MSKKEKANKNQTETEVAVEEKDIQNTEDKKSVKQEGDIEVSELEQTKIALQEEKDRFLRLFAEFENYKRRTSKERIELFKTAGQDVIQSMLPVLDDFDRALKEINKSEDKGALQGVELISNKLRETLKGKGLEAIDTKVGETFDPEIHEAVTQIPAPSDALKGKIVDLIEKGYKLGDKIIRFPKVVTGQ